MQEKFNIAVKGPSLVKEVDDDKASRGESDWRDVRALLIYQEKDVAQCGKDRRQILKRRVLAHVGTQEQWLKLLHLAFHEEGVYVAEELDKCIRYFEDHRSRMHYRQYRDAGMTIGSGAIESIHKWVVQARCRLAGMAWSEIGLNAMLRLRCLWASGCWDDEFGRPAFATSEFSHDSVEGLLAEAP